MEQKGAELSSREMQVRLPLLDQGIELLGEQQEGVGVFQSSW
jgi:hypothetical protein